LTLGVDFHAVDTVIQVGSPKGVARFMQAGRKESGHYPGATSKIYFVPTNSLEIIEGSACVTLLKQIYLRTEFLNVRSFGRAYSIYDHPCRVRWILR